MYACAKIVKKKHQMKVALFDRGLFSSFCHIAPCNSNQYRDLANSRKGALSVSILPSLIRHIYRIGKLMQEAVMATEKTRSQRISSAMAAAFTLVGLAGLVSSADHVACLLSCFMGIPVGAALEALPSMVLGARHIVQPCALGHLRLVEGILQISVSCWQVVLTLAGVAA